MSGALELADELAMSGAEFDAAGRGALAVMLRAAAELRRQHAVIEALAAIPDEIEQWAADVDRDGELYGAPIFIANMATKEARRRMAAVLAPGGAS